MNERSGTAPYRREDPWRLVAWLTLVAIFIALQYGGSSQKGEPLYTWSFFTGSVIQEAVLLLIVLAIAGFSIRRIALRAPDRRWRAAGLGLACFVAIEVFGYVYAALAHPGNEQHLTPSHWEARHAWAYVANATVICTAVPFVEEVTFRGLGFTLLRPYSRWFAIVAVGVLFGLAHGLLISLPILIFFGATLAWLRDKTDSVLPGMVVHGTFNLIALVAAVTIQR